MAQKTWLIRLADNLREIAGEEIEKTVMLGNSEISSSKVKTARWIKEAMERIDLLVSDEEKRKEILGNCCCYKEGRMKRARAIYLDSKNLDEFIGRLSMAKIVGTNLTREGNTIYIYYDRCYCGLVNTTREKISGTFCQCSRKYIQNMFEGIFERPLKVDLLYSVVNGSNECKFAVSL